MKKRTKVTVRRVARKVLFCLLVAMVLSVEALMVGEIFSHSSGSSIQHSMPLDLGAWYRMP